METTEAGGSLAIPSAVAWVQGTLIGTVAVAVAVLCVAAVGVGMMSGRVDARRGAAVVVGAFIVFGAQQIAAGLRAGTGAAPVYASVAATSAARSVPAYPVPATGPYDPYAGASYTSPR